ncbi:MAG: translation initiation factor IF-3 [Rhabdochlamydiaceae bacterium]
MKINREIRAPKVRVIDKDGSQLGIMNLVDALQRAELSGLDLVEIAPTAEPPVCKIIDYGKFRYQVTKKEKENKKTQHQVKVKEIKLKPNIDDHDVETKVKHAREFLAKGHKVRLICVFRGREIMHIQIGDNVVRRFCEELADLGVIEAPAKTLGKNITVVIAPQPKGSKSSNKTVAKTENIN